MRLIDADAMLERNQHSIYDTTDLKEMLDNEPTAYELSEVIEQLEDGLDRIGWDLLTTQSCLRVVKSGINATDGKWGG